MQKRKEGVNLQVRNKVPYCHPYITQLQDKKPFTTICVLPLMHIHVCSMYMYYIKCTSILIHIKCLYMYKMYTCILLHIKCTCTCVVHVYVYFKFLTQCIYNAYTSSKCQRQTPPLAALSDESSSRTFQRTLKSSLHHYPSPTQSRAIDTRLSS